MAKEGWLTPHERATITYPEVLPPHRNGSFAGTNGYVVQSVLTDLRKHGFSDRQIDRSGLRITTTIDPRMQQAAVHAEYSVLKNAPKDPVSGLAAVVPGNGAIRAMYGGRDYTSKAPTAQLNKATQIKRQPGRRSSPTCWRRRSSRASASTAPSTAPRRNGCPDTPRWCTTSPTSSATAARCSGPPRCRSTPSTCRSRRRSARTRSPSSRTPRGSRSRSS